MRRISGASYARMRLVQIKTRFMSNRISIATFLKMAIVALLIATSFYLWGQYRALLVFPHDTLNKESQKTDLKPQPSAESPHISLMPKVAVNDSSQNKRTDPLIEALRQHFGQDERRI